MMHNMAASLSRACRSGLCARGASACGSPAPVCAAAPSAAAAAVTGASALSAAAAAALAARPRLRSYGFGSHVSDNDPTILQREKERNLSGQTGKPGGEGAVPGAVENAPGWNPKLASDAESVVKAERAPDKPIEEMVEESVKQVTEATAAAAAEEEEKGGKDKGDE